MPTMKRPDPTIPVLPGHEVFFTDHRGEEQYGLVIDQGYLHPFRSDEKFYVVKTGYRRTHWLNREDIAGVAV